MSQKVNGETILKQLNWRYAVKQFDASKKISETDWNVLAESLRLSPSSYGLQPWKFLVVQNEELRKKLREVSWNQSQVTDCSHYVVLAYKKSLDEKYITNYVEEMAKTRGVPAEKLEEYRNMMIGDVVKGPRSQIVSWWTQRQAYIAMGFLLETAALLEVDACPMEGLDPAAYDKLLGLEGSSFSVVASVALGYRSDKDYLANQKKVRFAASDVIEIRK